MNSRECKKEELRDYTTLHLLVRRMFVGSLVIFLSEYAHLQFYSLR